MLAHGFDSDMLTDLCPCEARKAVPRDRKRRRQNDSSHLHEGHLHEGQGGRTQGDRAVTRASLYGKAQAGFQRVTARDRMPDDAAGGLLRN